MVGWTLNLSGTQITELPVDLDVGSDLNLSNTQITALPEDLYVRGALNLSGAQITELPGNFTCDYLYLDPERFSNVAFRKNCGDNHRTIFAVWTGETFYIAAGSFYGPIGKFEDAVNLKYSGEAAEAYKQAGRDCINELKEKLSANPQ
ncbi:hypothetical protein D8682_26230 [Buttiauxella sp. 3AFRM03]|uniref:hypothetical protein n=1 Tax=Buttiauxella sp. 3AFRM03 TaxID=2479367 RepID=UPI000EF76EAF|nr:hypothetical protein [Buttiauxella sp. 3AFRM03]AYN30170.1 hypothetical protein D8682_26230 [Buttiauxella sp. 3AFRM03]